jgi:ferredoxin
MTNVNKKKCIGCGACVATCPEVFELDDEGKAQVKTNKKDAKLPCIQEAIIGCPVGAISK